MEYIPYTYLIGWTNLDRWYYGVQYKETGKKANPINLWTNYHTSSKNVAYYREEYGEPDVIEVRKIFTNGTSKERRKASQLYEKRVLQRLNVTKNDRWINESITGNGHDVTPMWVRKKLSKALKGRKFTDEWKANLSKSKKGKPKTKAWLDKKPEIMEKVRLSHIGSKRTEESKNKMREKALARSKLIVVCPHCNYAGNGPVMNRWHFSNCRKKAS
jgi:hypothetical protein